MKKLEAKEHNWGLSGPGDWREIVWKVCDDASYSLRICYQPEYDDTPVPDKKIQGCLSSEDMISLMKAVSESWSEEETDACDGSAWEFTLTDCDAVVAHRPLGYIYGIEPFESIAKILSKYLSDEDDEFYKNNPDDMIWWKDTPDTTGEWLFSFDKVTVFNMFADYPWKLTPEQKKIFDRENPFWEEFFSDRKVDGG